MEEIASTQSARTQWVKLRGAIREWARMLPPPYATSNLPDGAVARVASLPVWSFDQLKESYGKRVHQEPDPGAHAIVQIRDPQLVPPALMATATAVRLTAQGECTMAESMQEKVDATMMEVHHPLTEGEMLPHLNGKTKREVVRLTCHIYTHMPAQEWQRKALEYAGNFGQHIPEVGKLGQLEQSIEGTVQQDPAVPVATVRSILYTLVALVPLPTLVAFLTYRHHVSSNRYPPWHTYVDPVNRPGATTRHTVPSGDAWQTEEVCLDRTRQYVPQEAWEAWCHKGEQTASCAAAD